MFIDNVLDNTRLDPKLRFLFNHDFLRTVDCVPQMPYHFSNRYLFIVLIHVIIFKNTIFFSPTILLLVPFRLNLTIICSGENL